jgi:hypothetical protein
MSGVEGLYVGEQITVTDARGVSGPGVVTAVDSGGFDVDVLFRHTDDDGDTVDQYCWYFLKGQSRGFGLKLDFTPYRAALSAIEGGGGALQPSPSEQAGGFTGAQLDAEAHSRWQHDGQMIQRAAFRDGAYWAAGLFAPPATPIAGGFGSSPDGDTHRAADTAVVGGQIAWRVGTPPQDGSTFYGHWWSPCRWLAYKPNSEQARRGVKGRWQTMNEFGGWVNASAPNEWATEAQIRARQQAAPASDTTARYEPEASEPKDAARRDEEAGR